jgi:nucleoside 2-deoxyribosyltransferase
VIQSTIISDLIEADLVVADLTEHNPNVMFELGVRMAHDKPVVLMKAEGTGPLFDVDNMLRVFEYSPNLWATTVEKDMPNLRDFMKGAWENRDSTKTYMKILRGRGKT